MDYYLDATQAFEYVSKSQKQPTLMVTGKYDNCLVFVATTMIQECYSLCNNLLFLCVSTNTDHTGHRHRLTKFRSSCWQNATMEK